MNEKFTNLEKLILPDFEPQEPYIGEIIPVSEYNVQQLCMVCRNDVLFMF